mgnify:CR=1 FL=1
MIDKERKRELLKLVIKTHAEALLEEQEVLSEQAKTPVKAKSTIPLKPASAETRAAIKALIKKSKRSI